MPPPGTDTKICQPPYSFPVRGVATDSTGGSGGPGPAPGGALGATTPPTTTETTGHASTEGAGCSVATGQLPSGSAFGLGALGMLALLLTRRRAKS
jgi:MYXO-CTERM domain-containing protein